MVQSGSLQLAVLALLYYSCVFLIRTAMFACTWSDQPTYAGLNFKTCLALAQTFGYACGKVPAIAFSPKLPHSQLREALVTVLIGSGACVTLACVVPSAVSLALVWLACVMLAPTYSLLQRFLEGRRDTEVIVAVVAFSFIGSSGLSKGIAADLLNWGYSEREAVAMCATAGTLIGVSAAFGVAAQPPPSAADVEKRGKRKAMTNYRAECEKLQREFGPGLGLCLVAYTLLGA